MYGLLQFVAPYQHWKSGLDGEKLVVNNISNKLGNEHALFNDVMLRDGKRLGNIDQVIGRPTRHFSQLKPKTSTEL